ncbi:MAG: penicillin-binding transpeptidase domain-containing protein [Dialister invisus]
MYPPGSTFKVITGATALEAKMVTPERYLIMEGIGLLIKEILKERLSVG